MPANESGEGVYYHVASRTYTPGDDLLCRSLVRDRGVVVSWKFTESDECDVGVVRLHESLDDAARWLVEHLPDGQIVRVTLPNGDDRVPPLVRDPDGATAVSGNIPSCFLTTILSRAERQTLAAGLVRWNSYWDALRALVEGEQ
jgi:hypothetical protein